MNFRYDIYLQQQLEIIARDVGLGDYIFDVAEEREFAKKKIEPNKIYVIVKYLASQLIKGAKTQPIQLLILTEQNDIQNTLIIFNQLASRLNFNSFTADDEYIKEQYTSPVVLSNFNQVAYGYRAVMYMTVNLFVLEQVADVEGFTIDGNNVDILSFNLSYAMTGDTQQRANEKLSTTVRSTSAVTIALTFGSNDNALLSKILQVVSGNTSGNQNFIIRFSINGVAMGNTVVLDANDEEVDRYYLMKLSTFAFVSSPAQVPVISVSLMV